MRSVGERVILGSYGAGVADPHKMRYASLKPIVP